MNQLNQLNDKDKYDDSNDKLKTIVISKKNYGRLKNLGFTGDSFNTVVGRILDRLEQEKD